MRKVDFIVLMSLLLCLYSCTGDKIPSGIEFGKAPARSLNTGTTSLSFGAEDNLETTMNVECENVSWGFANVPDWLSLSPSSGKTSSTITVRAHSNTIVESRSATIQLRSTDSNYNFTKDISVSQSAGLPTITPSWTSLYFRSDSSSETISFAANVEWTAECLDSWVTATKINSTELIISVSDNNSDERNSIIILKEQGKSETLAIISVSQSALPRIAPSKNSLVFDFITSSEIVSIAANVEWTAECSDSWVTAVKNSSTDLQVFVSDNYSDERNSTISLKEQGIIWKTLATISVRQKADTNPTETFNVNGVSFKMIKVDGGTFTMGGTSEQGSDAEDDEYPTHSVTLDTYYIGETEVTQELWEAVMGSNPSSYRDPKRPVNIVSWNDCQTFIEKLNSLTGKQFRLPTEAEWEFAARGGNKSRGYKYAGSNTIGEVAWYDGNELLASCNTIATKKANELGLYDMSGNVYEWCQDLWGYYSSGSQTNPTGDVIGSERVYRGGSWRSEACDCRVSYRYFGSQFEAYSFLGLRLAL